MSKEIVPASSEILVWRDTIITPNYDSWLIFIDKEPTANSIRHNCIYLYVNIETGKYERFDLFTGEPLFYAGHYGEDIIIKFFKAYHSNYLSQSIKESSPAIVEQRITTPNPRQWAVIISGGERNLFKRS